MKIYRKKEEYIYKHLSLNMSVKQMSDVMYAGFQTAAAFTTMWDMYRGEFDRKTSSRHQGHIVIHIHPEEVATFEKLTGLKLENPPRISVN